MPGCGPRAAHRLESPGIPGKKGPTCTYWILREAHSSMSSFSASETGLHRAWWVGAAGIRATQKLHCGSRGPRVEGDKVERGRDAGAGGPPPTRPQRWGPLHVPGKAVRQIPRGPERPAQSTEQSHPARRCEIALPGELGSQGTMEISRNQDRGLQKAFRLSTVTSEAGQEGTPTPNSIPSSLATRPRGKALPTHPWRGHPEGRAPEDGGRQQRGRPGL